MFTQVNFCGQDEPVARILELCILHIAMAEMTSKGTPHKVVINEVPHPTPQSVQCKKRMVLYLTIFGYS